MALYGTGEYVKVEFDDESTGVSEWMWVKVEYCDDRQRMLYGWLDDEPVIDKNNLSHGQRLAISYDKVRDHKKDFSHDS